MIVKSFLGIFLVIICVSITKQAPQARQQNNDGRPRFGNYVEHFLQYLDRQGVSDQEKINYLGEILSALSYFKFNDPNFLEYCAGQKIVQDGYRDAQKQKNHNNGDDGENILDRTNFNRFRDPSHENQREINNYDIQLNEDKNDPKTTHSRTTQDQYHKPTNQYQTRGIDGYHSSHIENHDEAQKGSSHENEDSHDDLHGDEDEDDYSYSDDNSSEDNDESSDDDDHLDDDDYQENSEDHDNDTQGYYEGNDEEKMEHQSIDGYNVGDQIQQTGNKDDTHVTRNDDTMGPSQRTTNRDRDNHHLNKFSIPRGSLNDYYNKYSDGSHNRDTYGRNSQNYDPYGRQSQENKPAFTKNDYSETSPSSSNSRDSYDPYNGHVGQRPIDEIEYSGDYDNTNSPAYTSNQVNDYLDRIRLHNLPPNLAKYAESYLNYAKNAVRTYGSYAKNFNTIRPCLESLVQYFNLLNDDLANAYERCQDDCFYSRLDSYSTSVTQYTATTNECIAKGMY
ncbi:uncharacterized protein LOC129801766 [Phlebotomus papatasi]|uniref:uncharacterized protein LOC129801766 n=1 Tax=Phlebotomus papatasi TaxID=29031 RepID=UPI002483644E|nr:uncharacterized protein LOC129801766 [Phlebotomus papatasi]